DIRHSHRAPSVIEAPAIPGSERFKRSQRHPAYVRVSKAHANAYAASEARAPTEESDQRRSPVVACRNRTGNPAPATRSMEPAAIVIRSPAPRIGADPRPTVVIRPNPAPSLVRSPLVADRGIPHVAILRIVLPRAVSVQILSAVNVGAHIAGAGR